MIISKVTENPGLNLSLEDTFFEKPQRGGRGGGGQIDPTPGRFRVKGQGFQYNHHARSFANFVHRKVKTITFTLLPKNLKIC